MNTDRSKAVPPSQFSFVCVSVVSYIELVLSLFVPHLSFLWCLGRAVFCDCRISLYALVIVRFIYRDKINILSINFNHIS